MAKIRLGAIAGAVSGSIGTWTFAHNRGGAYVRNRATPDTFTSQAAMDAKTRMSLVSAAWSGKTLAARNAWKSWAIANPVTDTLGEKRPLTGHQAFCGINTRLVSVGVAIQTLPPATPAPAGLITCTLTADIGAGDVALAFTPTPIGALIKVWMMGCVLSSPSINFVKDKLRFIGASANNQVTAYSIQTLVEARFGTLQIGQVLVIQAHAFDTVTGLLSTPFECRATVVTT